MKFGSVTLVTGFANHGEFVRLKASPRSSNRKRSPNGKIRAKLISVPKRPGPDNMFLPTLPNAFAGPAWNADGS